MTVAAGSGTIAGSRGTNTAPCVLPEIRLMAPGVDGPKVVPKKRSLMAKCCA